MYNITAHNGHTERISAPNIYVAIERFLHMTDLSIHDVKSVIFSV